MDMTTGSPLRLILLFSIPLIIGNIFQQFYTIVDTMVVGRVLGVTALAALGSVDTINWITTGAVLGMTQGFGILIAQKFGDKNVHQLNRIIRNSLLLSACLAVVLLVVVQLAINPFLVLLQVPSEIMPVSYTHLTLPTKA